MGDGDGCKSGSAILEEGGFGFVEVVGAETVEELVEAGGGDVLWLLVGKTVEADVPTIGVGKYVRGYKRSRYLPLICLVGIGWNEKSRGGNIGQVAAVRVELELLFYIVETGNSKNGSYRSKLSLSATK